MVKLIGVCLTVAACGNMGLTWAGVYEKRPRQLAALEGALQLLETEIMYAATPLAEAMTEVAEKCGRPVDGLFRAVAAELGKMNGCTAGEAWDEALEQFYPGTALNRQDLQVLKRFGPSLGASDREDQAKYLAMTKSQLKTAAAEAETEARKNAAVYRYLGFLGGLLLVLLLY